MRHALVFGNRTLDTVASSADIGPGGGTLELDGPATLTNVALQHNVSNETGQSGLAGVNGAFLVFNFNHDPKLVTVENSRINDNMATADSLTGSAAVQGAGVFNNSLLTMDGVIVDHDVGRARGRGGLAQGGGIWSGVDLSGPPVRLALRRSSVSENALLGSPQIKRLGGGLYTTRAVTLDHTVIKHNRPDQCVGCSLTPKA
jgi:hypothetical protein